MKMQPGTYCGNLFDLYLSESQSGKRFLALEFRVIHVSQGDQWAPLATPETRTVRLFLTDAAIDYSMDKLESLGFNGDFSNPSCAKTDNVTLTCDNRQYKDSAGVVKSAEDWNLYAERKQSERVAVPSDAIRQLTARWRSKHGAPAAPAATQPPAAPAPSPPAAPVDEGSIPF